MGFQKENEAFNYSGECREVQLLMPFNIPTNRIQHLLSAVTDERLSGSPCFGCMGLWDI